MTKQHSKTLVLCAAAFLSGCAQIPLGAGENPDDPWEKFNRNTTTFNDTLDEYVMEPVARGYRAVVPNPVREGVSNVFSNLSEPKNFLNNALQGNLDGAAASLYRLIVNTVFGLGGIFDVAGSVAGVAQREQGFGTTLGVWGVPSGPYLVLPFFGPSSVRDAPSLAVDLAAHPVTYVNHAWIRWGASGLRTVDVRTGLLPLTDTVKASVDPYVMTREAYLGNRRKAVGASDENESFAVDEFEDEDSEEM